MSVDDTGLATARQATDALACLQRYGHSLRPSGVRADEWALLLLDELTQTGLRFSEAVVELAATSDPYAGWVGNELRKAVELSCTRLYRHVQERPREYNTTSPDDSTRVVPFPTPHKRTPPTQPPRRG